VRATNWVGDAILSVPALREIRKAYRGAEVVVLARPWVADLYRRENFCDEVLVEEGRRWQTAGRLRQRKFDCAILLPNSFDAALAPWLARIPRRIGYARDGRGFLLTDAIPAPRPGEIPAHQRYYYLELLRRSGVIDEIPECRDIRLAADPEAGRTLFREFGVRSGQVVGISPGAQNSAAKQWLPERFAEVALRLAQDREAEVALFGTSAERKLCDRIAREIGPAAHNLAGRTTLGQLVDLAGACLAFVTNDSGSMHVAAAVGTPVVAIFGPTDAEATGPASSLARIVRVPVDCSPCQHRRCPIDHRCMVRVEASLVLAEALTLARPIPKSWRE
jgi:heptosyltransferase-2